MSELESALSIEDSTGRRRDRLDTHDELPEQNSVSDRAEKISQQELLQLALLQQEEEEMNTLPISREEFTMCMISIVVLSVVLVIQLF